MHRNPEVPHPEHGESPTAFADRLGRVFAATSDAKTKKKFGQFLTPIEVARHMAAQLTITNHPRISVLDPGAGIGILACAVCEIIASRTPKIREINLRVYEIDCKILEPLRVTLEYLRMWLVDHKIELTFTIVEEDFIKSNQMLFSNNLFETTNRQLYNVIVCNPPYFKLNNSDFRTQIARSIINGQSNIYALFLFACAKLLSENGRIVSITPRSFANGYNFRLFRAAFFSMIRPERLHLFHSRSKAFERDDVLQETVIMSGQRRSDTNPLDHVRFVEISSSDAVSDLDEATQRTVPEHDVIDMASEDKILRIPFSQATGLATEIIQGWPSTLGTYGLTVTTGKVVPYEVPSYMFHTGDLQTTHAPLLWMQHVTTMNVKFPLSETKKHQYLKLDVPFKSFMPTDHVYILIRRCSFKERDRKVIAAPLNAGAVAGDRIAFENHLNCIYSENNTLDLVLAYGVAALLNSTLVDEYLKTTSGSTQINVSELRQLPMPPQQHVQRLGRAALEFDDCGDPNWVDALVEQYILSPSEEIVIA